MVNGIGRREFLKVGIGVPGFGLSRQSSADERTPKEIWTTLTERNWGYESTGFEEYNDNTGDFGIGRDIAIIDTGFDTDSVIFNPTTRRATEKYGQLPSYTGESPIVIPKESPNEFRPFHLNTVSTLVEALGGDAWAFPSTIDEDQGHGTGRTSIVWQAAPNARYHIIRVGAELLGGSRVDNYIKALEATRDVQQAADDGEGFDVVLANLGITRSLVDPSDDQAKQLANDIADQGSIVIAPSGDGTWPMAPSNAEKAICVGSSASLTEIYSEGLPSNRRDEKPDVVAPGRAVAKLNPNDSTLVGYGSKSGYAAAHVAGMALLLSEYGSPQEVRAAIEETALEIEDTELDGYRHVSMMDAYRYLTGDSEGGGRSGADDVGQLIEIFYTNSPIEIGEPLEATARVSNPEEEFKEWEVRWGERTGDQIIPFETQSVSLNPLGTSSVRLEYEDYPEPPYPSPVMLDGEPAADPRKLGIHAFLRKDGDILPEYKSPIQEDDTEITIVDRRSPTRVTSITTNPRDAITATEELEVSASIVNIGPEPVTTDVSLHFGGRGPLDRDTISLEPGDQQTTTLSYKPTPHEVGENPITVSSPDDEYSTAIEVIRREEGDGEPQQEFDPTISWGCAGVSITADEYDRVVLTMSDGSRAEFTGEYTGETVFAYEGYRGEDRTSDANPADETYSEFTGTIQNVTIGNGEATTTVENTKSGCPDDILVECSEVTLTGESIFLGGFRVRFTDGSFKEFPMPDFRSEITIGSPGRVIDSVQIQEPVDDVDTPSLGWFEIPNPNADCTTGSKATTFECTDVTVEPAEQRGGGPTLIASVILEFADGSTQTVREPGSATQLPATFSGSGPNEGKVIEAVEINRSALGSTYYFTNEYIEACQENSQENGEGPLDVDLRIDGPDQGPATPGGDVVYSVLLKNDPEREVRDVVIEFGALPQGWELEFEAGSGGFDWDPDELRAATDELTMNYISFSVAILLPDDATREAFSLPVAAFVDGEIVDEEFVEIDVVSTTA